MLSPCLLHVTLTGEKIAKELSEKKTKKKRRREKKTFMLYSFCLINILHLFKNISYCCFFSGLTEVCSHSACCT